jgi:hypothetical protein
MLAAVHLFVGAAIGKATGNMAITIITSFLSHYILDLIPHYNPKPPKKQYRQKGWRGIFAKKNLFKIVEPVIGLAMLVVFIASQSKFFLIMSAGAFFAVLPDFISFFRWKRNYQKKHTLFWKIEKIWHQHLPIPLGLLPQIIIIALIILIF